MILADILQEKYIGEHIYDFGHLLWYMSSHLVNLSILILSILTSTISISTPTSSILTKWELTHVVSRAVRGGAAGAAQAAPLFVEKFVIIAI